MEEPVADISLVVLLVGLAWVGVELVQLIETVAIVLV